MCNDEKTSVVEEEHARIFQPLSADDMNCQQTY